jgi:hypothetical protein
MYKSGFTPDATSFSYVIDVMVNKKDFKRFHEIFDYVEMNNVKPSIVSLKKLALSLAKMDLWLEVEQVLQYLHKVSPNKLSNYFYVNIQYYRNYFGRDQYPDMPKYRYGDSLESFPAP